MTTPEKPSTVRPVEYKGDQLDAERGPGLGCFWVQLVLLVTFIVLTPLTVAWNMPSWISIALLFITLILLLFSGQTVIFLLRLVASDRREGRRVPLAASSPTVGEIEDTLPAADAATGTAADAATGTAADAATGTADAGSDDAEPAGTHPVTATPAGDAGTTHDGAAQDGPDATGVRE